MKMTCLATFGIFKPIYLKIVTSRKKSEDAIVFSSPKSLKIDMSCFWDKIVSSCVIIIELNLELDFSIKDRATARSSIN